MSGLKLIVLVKQVRDTLHLKKEFLKADGTVDKARLTWICNPADLKALELALKFKDVLPDSEVIVMTLGTAIATEIVRECLFRGAEKGILLHDRLFSGSDSNAKAYIISKAIRKLNGDYMVFTGHSSVSGLNGQVGQLIAHKLDLALISRVVDMEAISLESVTVNRIRNKRLQTVISACPCLITVDDRAESCRPVNVKRFLKYKHAKTITELYESTDDYIEYYKVRSYLEIIEWNANDINANQNKCGPKATQFKPKDQQAINFSERLYKSKAINHQDLEDLIIAIAGNMQNQTL